MLLVDEEAAARRWGMALLLVGQCGTDLVMARHDKGEGGRVRCVMTLFAPSSSNGPRGNIPLHGIDSDDRVDRPGRILARDVQARRNQVLFYRHRRE
jgi:hypothetical protein